MFVKIHLAIRGSETTNRAEVLKIPLQALEHRAIGLTEAGVPTTNSLPPTINTFTPPKQPKLDGTPLKKKMCFSVFFLAFGGGWTNRCTSPPETPRSNPPTRWETDGCLGCGCSQGLQSGGYPLFNFDSGPNQFCIDEVDE